MSWLASIQNHLNKGLGVTFGFRTLQQSSKCVLTLWCPVQYILKICLHVNLFFFLVMKFDTKFINTCTLETFHSELHREKVSTNITFISKGILILSIPLRNIIYYILITPVNTSKMIKMFTSSVNYDKCRSHVSLHTWWVEVSCSPRLHIAIGHKPRVSWSIRK